MKILLRQIIIILSVFCFSNNTFSQICDFQDPALSFSFDSIEDPDCPCEITQTITDVCYDFDIFENQNGELGIDNPFVLSEFHYPDGIWTGEFEFTAYTDLANHLNNVLPNNVDAFFQAFPGQNHVCAEDVSPSNFQVLAFCLTCPDQFNSPSYNLNSTDPTVDPTFTYTSNTVACEDAIPEIDPDDFGPNAGDPDNLPVFTMPDGDVVYTDEVVDGGFDDPEYNGPNANAIGNMVNLLVESGALQSGAGCNDLNCFDLSELVEHVNTPENAAYIDDNMDDDVDDEDIPDGYDSWSEAVFSELSLEVENLNLAVLLNDNFGLNIPVVDCDDGGYLLPELKSSKNKSSINRSSVNGLDFSLAHPTTEADMDYFDQDVAGLGKGSGSVSNPSPSAMEMIKNIKGGVDLYNGSQNTSIPLYTLLNNDVSSGISLSSSNNGIKVNDLGTIAGQHWNLNAGGMVTRVVKGIPDNFNGKVHGKGKGKIYKPKFIVDLPSNIGFNFKFPGSENVGTCDIAKKVKFGFNYEGDLGNSNIPDPDDSNSFLPIKVSISYIPIRPNVINITLSWPILNIADIVVVYAQVGLEVGFALNEYIDLVDFEEELTGFQRLSDSDKDDLSNFKDLSYSSKRKFIEKVHPSRKKEDKKYFSDYYNTWNEWWDAISESISGEGFKFETLRIDTEPDEFYYSVEGYSGKFYRDLDNDIVQIPFYKDLDISVNDIAYVDDEGIEHTIIGSIIIKTPEGMEYSFGSIGEGNSPGYAIDFIENTSYYLPNFYTYPELNTNRSEFGKAEIDEGVLVGRSMFGLKKAATYGETYDKNYKRMRGPRYASAWHLVSKKSLLSSDEITYSYTERPDLKYYSNKSFTHSFPNFDIASSGDKFITHANTELNLLHFTKTRWKNGRAEFAYTATQTELDRWDIIEINNQRGEKAIFYYEDENGLIADRAEIVGDKVCSKIEIYRNNTLFKGWKLNYLINSSNNDITIECEDEWPSEPSGPLVNNGNGFEYELGKNYSLKSTELKHHAHWFLNFNIGCLTVPFRFSAGYLVLKRDIGHRTSMSEFGSLAEVKIDLDEANELNELDIFNAESKRTFLSEILEIDRQGGHHPFLTIDYFGDPKQLPKRFSVNQDKFGYFNDNPSKTLLPAINYSSVNQTTISSGTGGVENHFGFHYFTAPNAAHLGQREQGIEAFAKIGALEKIKYATGGSISYKYNINQVPVNIGDYEETITGAGLRVSELKEDPFDMPARITSYIYENPSITHQPIRISQVERNVYNFEYEQRVVTSSDFQNEVVFNKNNFVGYNIVTESWEGIGESKHYFSDPYDYLLHIDGATQLNNIDPGLLRTKKRGLNNHEDEDGTGVEPWYYHNQNESDLPPSLQFYPQEDEHLSFLFGLEYLNEVFDAQAELIRRSETEYYYYKNACDSGSGFGQKENSLTNVTNPIKTISYLKSEMFQENHPGDYVCNYFHRLLKNLRPFDDPNNPDNNLDDLVNFIIGIITDGLSSLDHPCKNIYRDYYVSNRCIVSGNIRSIKNTTTDYFKDGTVAKVESINEYDLNDYYARVPRRTITNFWNVENTNGSTPVNVIKAENYFASDLNVPEFNDFEDDVVDFLKTEIKFNQPLFSKTYLGVGVESSTITENELIDQTYSALGRLTNGRVVAKSDWGLRNGILSLKGKVLEHDDSNGRPSVYRLAKYGTEFNDPIDLDFYFHPITFIWNGQIQLTQRKYEDFITSYVFDENTFELKLTTDPDGVFNIYTFDSRGRLFTNTTQSGLQTSTYTYNIGEGENEVATELMFNDGSPTQYSTQTLDGFGRELVLTRDNDNATINALTYDQMFRVKTSYTIGNGQSLITYEASPLPRSRQITDAVGNVVSYRSTGGTGEHFAKSLVTDPNGHTILGFSDGVGRNLTRQSGEGGATHYIYDNKGRLDGITNPIGEGYDYIYNAIDKLSSKKIPGSNAKQIWWDKAFRPVVFQDANGYQVIQYDKYNRIIKIVKPLGGFNPDNAPGEIKEEDAFETDIANGELLLLNEYVDQKTWLKKSIEGILTNNGIIGQKVTDNIEFDDIGRPVKIQQDYPNTVINSNHIYNAFGGINQSDFNFTFQTGQLPILHDYAHYNSYDALLRPSGTRMSMGTPVLPGTPRMLNTLYYNDYDQVITKLIGGQEELPLQKVDYRYDAIGRLTHINSPGEMECFQDMEVCALSAKFIVTYLPSPGNCRFLTSVKIDGQSYDLNAPVDLLNNSISVAEIVQDALDELGYFGEVTEDNVYYEYGTYFNILVTNTNTQDIKLYYDDCDDVTTFLLEECCENETNPGDNQNQNSNPSADLYYQYIEYTGIDINRIEISSYCNTGLIRNDYTYDGDHRVKTMKNKIFTPTPIYDAYNTSYNYDPAGNIMNLSRRGLVDVVNGDPVYDDIDIMTYYYGQEKLQSVEEDMTQLDPLHQPKGFVPVQSIYHYDGNGNMTIDEGKGLTIDYNLLNLPKSVAGQQGSMLFEYAFGGGKVKQEGPSDNRYYLGGFEIIENNGIFKTESYQHGDGRIVFDNQNQGWQFKIVDNLGNTVVLFEDKDGDHYISPDLSNDIDPDNDEVLQRNLYYPFGLAMDGTWNDLTNPRMDYLYNGKELQEELDLNWLSFGFREYDPAIGRFPSVDPIADQFAWASPFNYAENTPIGSIDLWGLQELGAENGNQATGQERKKFFPSKGNPFLSTFPEVEEETNEVNPFDLTHRATSIKPFKDKQSSIGLKMTLLTQLDVGGFGHQSITVKSDKNAATGFWEWEAEASNLGLGGAGMSAGPVGILIGNRGELSFSSDFLLTQGGMSLAATLNKVPFLDQTGFGVGFSFNFLDAYEGINRETLGYSVNGFGYGLFNLGFGGSHSVVQFNSAHELSESDSIRRATINYKGGYHVGFKEYLLNKKGQSFIDSLNNED